MFDINSSEIKTYLQSGKIDREYPTDCLPAKLQTPTTKKSKMCQFEKLDMNLYEKDARMVGFRTTECRILPWLKALGAYYYEFVGKKPDMNVEWVDSPEVVSTSEPLKNVTIEIFTGETKLYKITFHIKTGFIQVQGNKFDEIFAQKDFPILLHIVHSLKGPIELKSIAKDETKSETLVGQDLEVEESADQENTFTKVLVTNDSQTSDTNNNSATNNNNEIENSTQFNDGLSRIEATLVDTVAKIHTYQQSVESEINTKLQDLFTITSNLQKTNG